MAAVILSALVLVGVFSAKLSVPLLVLQNGSSTSGTAYLVDPEGRSDTIAWALKDDATLSKATVERFVALGGNETLISFLERESNAKLGECPSTTCPGAGQSCFVVRSSSVTDADGAQKLQQELNNWKSSTSGAACRIVFSADKINETPTVFPNAWAPVEAATFSLVSIVAVTLFLLAVLPSLLIKDAEITPEIDSKAD